MDINLEKVVAALQRALSKQNPEARVTYEQDADQNEGQTYRMHGTVFQDPLRGAVFDVNAHSSLYVEFPDGFAVYEISNPEGIDDHTVAFTIRVGKIGEVEKRRIRVAQQPQSNKVKVLYEALRALEPTIPEFDHLDEVKAKIFISQLQTLRMTMKM